MELIRFKFQNFDGVWESFTLNFTVGQGDAYTILLDKLAELGYPADGKVLVNPCIYGEDDISTINIIDDQTSLWNIIEAMGGHNGAAVIKLQYDMPAYTKNRLVNDGIVYFRFKEDELCRRFSLKLDKDGNAYNMLLTKLDHFGYKSHGRQLVCLEEDGTRTIIDDCNSLWAVIEMKSAYGPTVSLSLEYYSA
ncbi:hypothetical protein Tcan_01193, partial [Toxocara canis]|uniref:Phage tail protein n=2 Tax=Toxocara canis TaxID=6265 RepID=A0A183U8J1_TOXCA